MNDFLKKIPLFASLPEHDLDRLCEMVTEVNLPAGAALFAEGSPGDQAYVIKEGEIEILKASGGRSVLIAVRKPGEVIGEMALLEAAPRFASGRARTDSVLLAISHTQLEELLNTSPSAARAMLFTITSRLRSTELMLKQSEKMAQLGTLTAGIAHELNNPAAAAQRGAAQLITTIERLQQLQFQLNKYIYPQTARDELLQLAELARERGVKPIEIDSLDRSDRESELEAWLDEHGVENGWELAPVLASLGYEVSQLERLAVVFTADHLPLIITWLGETFVAYSLLAEINQGTSRISEIVKSLKTYAYLDQAPVQLVDLHEGLDNTLVMLRHKLKQGVNLKREYTNDLPRIQAFGSELNQVWTNIIDNAIDAMDGHGEIILRTRHEGDWVIVEIEDNGPGIPPDVQEKIFSPFFTTKPVGKGTGLGLNITYNIVQKHGGEIKVFSQPGKTRFQICLPINFEKVQSGSNPITTISEISDDRLRQILATTRKIAVVGISDHQEQPNYTVPAYLQAQGYQIYPVNPNLDEVLGEIAYPDLLAVPDAVDVVLVFRRSEVVPPVVEQAIRIGAKVVWMQEGIVNEAAASAAREAGLDVVMDTCMRATHKRLMGKN
jgi:signal transduction histidine kinase/predicted CoA-binding protein